MKVWKAKEEKVFQKERKENKGLENVFGEKNLLN